jgi:hypothetical protein
MTGDWFDGNGSGKQLDVVELLNTAHVHQGIAELVGAGSLVSMGLTSDGGAMSFTVTVDGRWRREYFRDGGELLAWIAQALPAVHEARGHPVASSAPRGRTRRS